MSAESTEKRFVQRMRELLVSLPYDMKVLFEAVTDGNLPLPARRWAAGAAIYCLSPSDPLPDSMGLLGFVDDVVVVRVALKRFLEIAGEDGCGYPERFPEQFRALDEDLVLLKTYLDDVMDWLQGKMEKTLHKSRYKGKDAEVYVEEEEASFFLYDEGQDFTTAYEIDDEAAAKLQSGKAVLEAFRRRMAEESRRIA